MRLTANVGELLTLRQAFKTRESGNKGEWIHSTVMQYEPILHAEMYVPPQWTTNIR